MELLIYDFSHAKCVGIQSPLHFHALQMDGCCAGCNAGGLGQVEHAEPGGGDRQGGTEACDGLWQEVGCGRTSVEMLRDKMSCSGPFCWGNNTLHLNLSQNQGTPSQNHTYNSEKEIENDFGRKELPETQRMELLGETVPPIPKDVFWENRGMFEKDDITTPKFCGPNRSGTVPENIVIANHKTSPGK